MKRYCSTENTDWIAFKDRWPGPDDYSLATVFEPKLHLCVEVCDPWLNRRGFVTVEDLADATKHERMREGMFWRRMTPMPAIIEVSI